MMEDNQAEESTAHKLDSTDESVGIDDERFEWSCARSTKDVYRDMKHLEGYVQRGVRSVRNATIDSDSLNGLAQQAYACTGNRWRTAWKLGRAWALSSLPTFAELRLRERRHAEARERRDGRMAKRNWERGQGWKNFELFCDEPA